MNFLNNWSIFCQMFLMDFWRTFVLDTWVDSWWTAWRSFLWIPWGLLKKETFRIFLSNCSVFSKQQDSFLYMVYKNIRYIYIWYMSWYIGIKLNVWGQKFQHRKFFSNLFFSKVRAGYFYSTLAHSPVIFFLCLWWSVLQISHWSQVWPNG